MSAKMRDAIFHTLEYCACVKCTAHPVYHPDAKLLTLRIKIEIEKGKR